MVRNGYAMMTSLEVIWLIIYDPVNDILFIFVFASSVLFLLFMFNQQLLLCVNKVYKIVHSF